jgi:hypothetical protein
MKQATREQRLNKLHEIETSLALYSLTRNIYEIGQLLDIAQQFVEDGVSVSGNISLETGQRIEYLFSNKPDPRQPNKAIGQVVIKKLAA